MNSSCKLLDFVEFQIANHFIEKKHAETFYGKKLFKIKHFMWGAKN